MCIAGDGSIQMNLQELQTLVSHKVPAKIFVLNNQGYHSIRQTQHNFFNGHVVGCGEESGLNFPSLEKLAAVYGIPFSKVLDNSGLKKGISDFLAQPGIGLCEIVLNLDQAFEPKLSSRRLPDGKMVTVPLEDMFPFLSREELKENMLVPLAQE
jgi:acetolactate synthase-1/2/3 large subunit